MTNLKVTYGRDCLPSFVINFLPFPTPFTTIYDVSGCYLFVFKQIIRDLKQYQLIMWLDFLYFSRQKKRK